MEFWKEMWDHMEYGKVERVIGASQNTGRVSGKGKCGVMEYRDESE
jgi:hypothetical protein